MGKDAWKATVIDGKLDKYIRKHNGTGAEMLEVLNEAGIKNYTTLNAGNEPDPVAGAQPRLRPEQRRIFAL